MNVCVCARWPTRTSCTQHNQTNKYIYKPTLGSRQIQEPVLDPLSRYKLVRLKNMESDRDTHTSVCVPTVTVPFFESTIP